MLSSATLSPLLAIYPSQRGFGFAVASQQIGLTDWGLAIVHSKSLDAFLQRVDALVFRNRVKHIVVESFSQSRRGCRAQRCIEHVALYARERNIVISAVTRSERFTTLELTYPVASNHDLAVAVAMRFPELEVHLPSRRRRWQSEDERIAMFAAVSCLLVDAIDCYDQRAASH